MLKRLLRPQRPDAPHLALVPPPDEASPETDADRWWRECRDRAARIAQPKLVPDLYADSNPRAAERRAERARREADRREKS